MGSRSTYMKAQLGGYCGRKLSEGDMIGFCNPKPNVSKARFSIPKFKSDVTILRVILGPQDDLFTQTGIDTFLSGEFSMTFKFDRMGCQLDGPFIEHTGSANIISDAIAFGAIQMPEHGHPIIMLADRQTVGGYPKIANVISVDLPKLVQCKLGSKIRFKAIEIADAQNLLINSNVGNY
jgi:allophanate hydrolase subunit 2